MEKKYCCHCTIKGFDFGLNTETRANHTFTVQAKYKEEAIHLAKIQLINKYIEDEQYRIEEVTVDLIKEI